MCEDCIVDCKCCNCECGLLLLVKIVDYTTLTVIKSISYCNLCNHYVEIKHKNRDITVTYDENNLYEKRE